MIGALILLAVVVCPLVLVTGMAVVHVLEIYPRSRKIPRRKARQLQLEDDIDRLERELEIGRYERDIGAEIHREEVRQGVYDGVYGPETRFSAGGLIVAGTIRADAITAKCIRPPIQFSIGPDGEKAEVRSWE
ncbi:hypothetical protein [Brevibacterium album]|uniref:hypothetical protein n=1 Tax=Brevibacterium album TaxID=417948 RepID=UPI0012EBE5C8|nr:hypothetical protein [Brevibacterium album]